MLLSFILLIFSLFLKKTQDFDILNIPLEDIEIPNICLKKLDKIIWIYSKAFENNDKDMIEGLISLLNLDEVDPEESLLERSPGIDGNRNSPNMGSFLLESNENIGNFDRKHLIINYLILQHKLSIQKYF